MELTRLGDRLDVIEAALSIARNEPEPEHRGRLLDTLDRATAVVRAEHTEASSGIEAEEKRSTLRLIPGARRPEQTARPSSEASAQGARSTDRTRARARR